MLVRSLRVFGLYHPAQSFSGSKTMATIPVKNGNPMELLIRDKLVRQFSPVHLDIINESYMHNVPKGSETHFKVVVVSDKFENTSLLQVREKQNVYQTLFVFVVISFTCRGIG